MNANMFFEMGLNPKVVVSISNAPVDSARGQMELEMLRDINSLNADVQSVIYSQQRGLLVAY